MKDDVGERLVALGIPRSRHTIEELTRLFPPELQLDGSGMDAGMLAELLVVMLENGVITLDRGLDAARLGRRHAGSHACHLYCEEDDFLELVPVFFEAGLARDERCLWMLPSWLSRDAAIDHMAEDIRDKAEIIEQPAFGDSVRDAVSWWRAQEEATLAAGFSALRCCIDRTWQLATESWERLVQHERSLHHALSTANIVTLCTYSACSADDHRLASTVRAHECAVVRRDVGWEEIFDGPAVREVIRALAEDRCR